MKEIKVYLQYPWKFPDSPYYKYLTENPPKSLLFLNAEKQKGVITNIKRFRFLNSLKNFIRFTTNLLRVPIPNAYKTKTNKKYDLIHCAHCLSLNKTPWVMDIEDYWQFWISGKRSKLAQRMVKKILLSENCKKILPWSEFSKQRILNVFPELKEKIEVVYPAVPFKGKEEKKEKPLRILYASRYFWIKGGLMALETLKMIKEKFPMTEIIFISDVPEEIKIKYKGIIFKEVLPQEKLFSYLKNSDLFFYPSLIDTFGFLILEAMSFGVPTLAVYHAWGTHSVKEIIEDGKNGFLVEFKKDWLEYYKIGNDEKELIKRLFEKLSLMVQDKKLRRKMSEECIKIIKNGKFSIQRRNKKLRKIYEESMK